MFTRITGADFCKIISKTYRPSQNMLFVILQKIIVNKCITSIIIARRIGLVHEPNFYRHVFTDKSRTKTGYYLYGSINQNSVFFFFL